MACGTEELASATAVDKPSTAYRESYIPISWPLPGECRQWYRHLV